MLILIFCRILRSGAAGCFFIKPGEPGAGTALSRFQGSGQTDPEGTAGKDTDPGTGKGTGKQFFSE